MEENVNKLPTSKGIVKLPIILTNEQIRVKFD